jgi:hypothetical protein
MVTLRGRVCRLVERAPTYNFMILIDFLESDHLLSSGRVAQLGEHLLCKHAFISPKSLNRRLLTVQTLC